MPRGTTHRETGILCRAPLGYALEMDGGGKWMLDISGSVRKLIGKRVTIEGKRMGFDMIYVDRIWHEGKQRRISWLNGMGFWFVLAALAIPFLAQLF